MSPRIKAINWNKPEDERDLTTWDRVTSNFWLPEKIPLSNDIPSWRKLSSDEKLAVKKVFGGLALLDTIQGHIGAEAIAEYAQTSHEVAVMRNFGFMEEVHAKSYSSVFSTFCSTQEIDDIFNWLETDEATIRKSDLITSVYALVEESDYPALTRRAVSVLLESFLFYSGFYLPLHFAAEGKLTNTADMIRLILRDEGVHGLYIGNKFQQELVKLSEPEKVKIESFVRNIASELYVNEIVYTKDIYDPIGLTSSVETYMRYNLNKAMKNLGYFNFFPESLTQVDARILSQMATDSNETHDFFSGAGSAYVVGKRESTSDDDWS